MMAKTLQLLVMSIVLLLPLGLYGQDKNSLLCREFQRHLNRNEGLVAYAVKEKEIDHKDFNFAIAGVDIDGDKIDEKILLLRTGSVSFSPTDDDRVALVLSSTGEEFTAEMQRFSIILYKSKYYVVASEWLGKKGLVFVDIKSMGADGFKQLCSYKCGPKTGSCTLRRHHQ